MLLAFNSSWTHSPPCSPHQRVGGVRACNHHFKTLLLQSLYPRNPGVLCSQKTIPPTFAEPRHHAKMLDPSRSTVSWGFTCSSTVAGFVALLALWRAFVTLSLDKLNESEGAREAEGTECSKRTSRDTWTSDTKARKRNRKYRYNMKKHSKIYCFWNMY